MSTTPEPIAGKKASKLTPRVESPAPGDPRERKQYRYFVAACNVAPPGAVRLEEALRCAERAHLYLHSVTPQPMTSNLLLVLERRQDNIFSDAAILDILSAIVER